MTTAVAIFKSEGKVTFCGTEYFLVIQAARLSMMDSVPKKTCQNFLLILFFKPELWVGILNVIIRMQSTLPKFPPQGSLLESNGINESVSLKRKFKRLN